MTYMATSYAFAVDGGYVRELAAAVVPTIRSGRAWCHRNTITWQDALEPAESGFGVTIANGEIAVLISHRRDGPFWVASETKQRM